MDYLEFQRLAGKVKSGNADFEIEKNGNPKGKFYG